MGSIIAISSTSSGTKTWLPDPKRGGLTVSYKDLDSSATTRNIKGTLVRDRIATKVEVAYSAPPLTNTEISSTLKAISAETFYLTYPDPMTGANRTAKVYCGDRSAPAYSCINGEWMWEGLSMTFIEV